jgi:hypothetical protein
MRPAESQVRSRTRTSAGLRLAWRAFGAGVAQLAEQPSCKRQVSGSIPLTGSQVRVGFLGVVGAQLGISAVCVTSLPSRLVAGSVT